VTAERRRGERCRVERRTENDEVTSEECEEVKGRQQMNINMHVVRGPAAGWWWGVALKDKVELRVRCEMR
jgi:hypothetical protein